MNTRSILVGGGLLVILAAAGGTAMVTANSKLSDEIKVTIGLESAEQVDVFDLTASNGCGNKQLVAEIDANIKSVRQLPGRAPLALYAADPQPRLLVKNKRKKAITTLLQIRQALATGTCNAERDTGSDIAAIIDTVNEQVDATPEGVQKRIDVFSDLLAQKGSRVNSPRDPTKMRLHHRPNVLIAFHGAVQPRRFASWSKDPNVSISERSDLSGT